MRNIGTGKFFLAYLFFFLNSFSANKQAWLSFDLHGKNFFERKMKFLSTKATMN